jgi:hypothetical protein
MTTPQQQEQWERAELLNLLSASATLAGLCITVVALMNTLDRAKSAISITDDVLAICAAAFLLCTYLIFWALRAKSPGLLRVLLKAVDVVFLVSLSAMTLAAFIMIYTIW